MCVIKDEMGNRYGNLTVLHRESNTAHWRSKCDCDKEVVVQANNLSVVTPAQHKAIHNEAFSTGGAE